MLPPILEIYIVWHPGDSVGSEIAGEIIEHFHGSAFTGLIGGAVEVLVRSDAWQALDGAPRAIPTPSRPGFTGLAQAMFTAIVPLLGNGMAAAVQLGHDWRSYLLDIVNDAKLTPARVGVFPYRLHPTATDGTELGTLLSRFQTIAASAPELPHDSSRGARCRDLSQALAQFVSGNSLQQQTVFISHTKHASGSEPGDVDGLIQLVREVIGATHMREFFDARDLQPGADWADALIRSAGRSALLAL